MATVAATGTSSRDARRRRILERGSDRLALITGRIQSLPPDPDQSRPQESLSGQAPSDPSQHEAIAVSDSSLTNHESGKKPSQCHTLDETEEPLLPNHKKVENISSREAGESSVLDSDKGKSTSSKEAEEPLTTLNDNRGKDITSRAAALLGIEDAISQISSSSSIPTQGSQRAKTLRSLRTADQLRSAIAATENIRLCSSAAIAILVVLSFTGFPIPGGTSIKNIILFRPLYLLLLTNISIVIACYITRGQDSGTQQRSRASAAGVSEVIEAGLMLQNIITALFMDFGIYAILVICGHSIVQTLGW